MLLALFANVSWLVAPVGPFQFSAWTSLYWSTYSFSSLCKNLTFTPVALSILLLHAFTDYCLLFQLLKENLTDLKKRTITISLDKQVILVSGCINWFSPTSSASFLLREEKEPSKLLSPSDLLITGASYDIPSAEVICIPSWVTLEAVGSFHDVFCCISDAFIVLVSVSYSSYITSSFYCYLWLQFLVIS